MGAAINVAAMLLNGGGTWQMPAIVAGVILLWAAAGMFAPRWHEFVLRRAGYLVTAEEHD